MNRRKNLLNEEKLIDELIAKTQLGAESLYDMYSRNLFGLLLKMVNDRELAEDLLQKSFIKIWYSIESYNASKGRLFTWMLVITKNLARDFLRSKQYHQSLTTEPLEFNLGYLDQYHTIVFNTDTIGIKTWVDRLKKEHSEIVNLIYYKGYTHMEVAEELKIPLGTVKTRCRMAISILKNKLSEPAQTIALAI